MRTVPSPERPVFRTNGAGRTGLRELREPDSVEERHPVRSLSLHLQTRGRKSLKACRKRVGVNPAQRRSASEVRAGCYC